MIKVGSRESKLAVVQAEEVCRALGDCELITMKTLGDMILDKTLDQVGGKGLFVKELDRALADRRVDLTVHSLKDVPMEQPAGLPLVAYTKREDARDALVLPQSGKWDKSKPIGCSSARRRVQLAALFRKPRSSPCAAMCSRGWTSSTAGNTARSCSQRRDCTGSGWKTASAGIFAGGAHPCGGAGDPCRAGPRGRADRGGQTAGRRGCARLRAGRARLCAHARRRVLCPGCGPMPRSRETICSSPGCTLQKMKAGLRAARVTGRRSEAETLGRTLALQLKQQAEGTV